eukprot:scaffold1344_cov102-Cylindrotheca_fusiformis.AAC.2
MMNLQQYFYHLANETGAQEFTLVTDHARSDLNHRNQHLFHLESSPYDKPQVEIAAASLNDATAPNCPTQSERFKTVEDLSKKSRNLSLKKESPNMSLDNVFDELEIILFDGDDSTQFEKLSMNENSKISPQRPVRRECTDDLLLNCPGLGRIYELCNGYNAHVAKSNDSETNNQFRIHLDPVGYQHYRHGKTPLLPTKVGASSTHEFQRSRVLRRNSINSGYTSSNRHKLQSRWDYS